LGTGASCARSFWIAGLFVLNETTSRIDFRFSVLKAMDGDATSVVSTICTVHNVFGKIYLLFIVPFHRMGVR
jgi:Protein of unknown function (DUF2867)